MSSNSSQAFPNKQSTSKRTHDSEHNLRDKPCPMEARRFKSRGPHTAVFFRRLHLSSAAKPLNMASKEPKQGRLFVSTAPPRPHSGRRTIERQGQALAPPAGSRPHGEPAGLQPPFPRAPLCGRLPYRFAATSYPSTLTLVAAYPRQVSLLWHLQIPPNPLLHQERLAAAAQGDREARHREVALRSVPSACLAQGDRLASHC